LIYLAVSDGLRAFRISNNDITRSMQGRGTSVPLLVPAQTIPQPANSFSNVASTNRLPANTRLPIAAGIPVQLGELVAENNKPIVLLYDLFVNNMPERFF
jgi:hypothetical protein